MEKEAFHGNGFMITTLPAHVCEIKNSLNDKIPMSEHDCAALVLKLLQFFQYRHVHNTQAVLLRPEHIIHDGNDLLVRLQDPDGDTPDQYIPPEDLDPKGNTVSQTLWCLGILIYECLTGSLPPIEFGDGGKVYGLEHIFDDPNGHAAHISSNAQDAIKAFLREDPRNRPTPAAAMNLRWFRAARESPPVASITKSPVLSNPVEIVWPIDLCAQ
jgi:hypothetical protein